MSAAALEPPIAIRRLRRGERRPVLEVFAGLSERSRRLRFLGPSRGSPPRRRRLLAAELREVALRSGLTHLTATVACGNAAAVALVRQLGRPVEMRIEDGAIQAFVAL